jgi:hypothetical protein
MSGAEVATRVVAEARPPRAPLELRVLRQEERAGRAQDGAP